jgi:outer membrane protein assembly factor BamB
MAFVEREEATEALTRRGFLRLSAGGVTVVAFMLATGGCGGGSGSNGGGNRNRVEVALAWPERQPAGQSRYIPPYALSVVLELYPKATPNDPNAKHSQTVNRPDGNAAVTQTVYFDQELKVGTYVLTGEARTQKDSGGTTVARAQMECEVRRNETTRPELTLASPIAQVEILGRPLELLVGEQKTLTGRALDAAGQMVFLPEGALVYQQVSGAEQMSVTPEGRLTGLTRGVARVRLSEPQINRSDEADVTVRNYDDGLAASPWPKLHGNLANTGRSNSNGAIGVKKWEFQRKSSSENVSPITSPVIAIDGTVYIGSSSNVIFALDGATGAEKWRFGNETHSRVIGTPAIGSNGMIYVPMPEGMYGLDAATGAKQWEYAAQQPGRSNLPVFPNPSIGADGTVYAGGVDGLYTFDGMTGAVKGTFPTEEAIWDCPAITTDGTVYFATSTSYARSSVGKIFAIHGRNLAKKWEFPYEGWATSLTIGADGTLYFGTYLSGPNDSIVYALDGVTGAKKWEIPTDGEIRSTLAIGPDGTLYCATFYGTIHVLDGATGAKKLEIYAGGQFGGGSLPFLYSSPTIGADGTVYIGNHNGWVYAFDGQTGNKKWELRNAGGDSHIAIGADGTLYTVDGDTVYAIG